MKLKAGSLNTAVRMINPATMMKKESEGIINHVKNEKSDITQFLDIHIAKRYEKTIRKKCHASKLNLELTFILRYHARAKQQKKKKKGQIRPYQNLNVRYIKGQYYRVKRKHKEWEKYVQISK